VNKAHELITVPKEPLDDLERGFLHLWFMVNRVAGQIEKGAEVQPLARVLRQEVNEALIVINKWRLARWEQEGGGETPPP
jgi:hypothetical protein